MNETSLIICFIINIVVCFGIPLGALVYLVATKKKAEKSFFVGICIFLIFQVFFRMPLLQYVLSKMDWYNIMNSTSPIAYGLFLGLTAGLFEEVGRFLGFKIFLKKNLRWIDGFAFGIGHGGIEAMLLVGTSFIQRLIILISLNNGTFDPVKIGVSEESVRASFLVTTNIMVLIGGLERIFALTAHVGFTLIVLYGIKKGKLIYLGLAILVHAIVDSTVAIFPKIFGIGIIGIEVFIGISAIMFFIYIIKSRKFFRILEGVNIK